MRTYKNIISETVKVAIWDNCDFLVDYSKNADKFRVTYDYTKWQGNSASLATHKKFVSGKIGRRALKLWALTLHQDKYCDFGIWTD